MSSPWTQHSPSSEAWTSDPKIYHYNTAILSEISIKLYSLSIMSLTCIKHHLSDFHYVLVGLTPLQGTIVCVISFKWTDSTGTHYIVLLSEISIKLYSLSIMSLTCIKHHLSDFHCVLVGLTSLQKTVVCIISFIWIDSNRALYITLLSEISIK